VSPTVAGDDVDSANPRGCAECGKQAAASRTVPPPSSLVARARLSEDWWETQAEFIEGPSFDFPDAAGANVLSDSLYEVFVPESATKGSDGVGSDPQPGRPGESEEGASSLYYTDLESDAQPRRNGEPTAS
jgi:hypothetical protein